MLDVAGGRVSLRQPGHPINPTNHFDTHLGASGDEQGRRAHGHISYGKSMLVLTDGRWDDLRGRKAISTEVLLLLPVIMVRGQPSCQKQILLNVFP